MRLRDALVRDLARRQCWTQKEPGYSKAAGKPYDQGQGYVEIGLLDCEGDGGDKVFILNNEFEWQHDDSIVFGTENVSDVVIGNTLSVLLFVGLSFIILGIGFAIATIVRHLRAAGQATLDACHAGRDRR